MFIKNEILSLVLVMKKVLLSLIASPVLAGGAGTVQTMVKAGRLSLPAASTGLLSSALPAGQAGSGLLSGQNLIRWPWDDKDGTNAVYSSKTNDGRLVHVELDRDGVENLINCWSVLKPGRGSEEQQLVGVFFQDIANGFLSGRGHFIPWWDAIGVGG